MAKYYKILGKIDEGGSCVVYKGRHLVTEETVALKQLIKLPSTKDGEAGILVNREIKVLKELMTHENIIQLEDSFVVKKISTLVFEYMDKDLFDYIGGTEHTIDRRVIKKFLHQILCGIAHCHSRNILHLDIKPGNILINLATNALKIADFGLSRSIANLDDDFEVVTSGYKSPELLLRCQYSMPVDIWAIGCVFAEMVNLTGPFFVNQGTEKDQLSEIFSVLGTPTEDTWPWITSLPSFHKHDLPKCDPQNLATYVPNIEPKGLDLLTKMLCCNPSKRITAAEALEHDYFTDLEPALVHPLLPGTSGDT